LEYILAFRLVKNRSYCSLSFGFIIARSLSFQSAESTQLWKKLRLSFGRSSSVGGGVRKLGLAGTGGVISAETVLSRHHTWRLQAVVDDTTVFV
jgi:hypothetical protein